MTGTVTIPLNKLIAWDGNVRKTGITDGIDELAASISAHRLLQAPVVRKVNREMVVTGAPGSSSCASGHVARNREDEFHSAPIRAAEPCWS